MKRLILLAGGVLAAIAAAARAQTPVTLVNWDHSWQFFHPMGTLPSNAGNFLSTWYLPAAQYDSPLPFGAVPEVVGIAATTSSYDSGNGRSPLGYGGIDFVTNNAAAAGFAQIAEPSRLTTPNSGFRRTAYFKTTFTVPAGGVTEPKLEFLCDDGAFIYLDGVPIATVNITNGVTDIYTSPATNATNTETDAYILDFATTGVRTLTGKVNNTLTMPVNVLSTLTSIGAGTHTLAISVHNAATDSSDLALAAKLTALSDGCTFSTTTGTVTRLYNNTPGNPADDTLSVTVTVNAGTNNAPAWNVTASAPGDPANVTSGAYGSTNTFLFPVSTLTGNSVTLTFTDGVDTSCLVPVTVSLPAPPFVLGRKRINGVETDLYSSNPLPTAWANATPRVFTCNGGGSDRNVQILNSETLDLTGLPRPVTIVATFRANETSTGSNFEGNDNFSADVIHDGGAIVSMLPAGTDSGDGTLSHPTAIEPEQPNGPANGWLNGYTGIATLDPNTPRTQAEDYLFYSVRDEFNFPPETLPAPQPVPWAGSLDRTFNISYSVPDTVNSVSLSFRGGNDSTSEFFTLSGIRIYNGACDMQAVASNVVRNLGALLDDPSDDTISCQLLVTGTGSQWTYGVTAGNYGTPQAIEVPVSQSGIPQTVSDSFDGTCSTTFTVTAPPAPLIVTAAEAQGTTFSAATAAGSGATSYVRPVGGTELGWTGGDADVIATAQPEPNTTARYLDINGKTPASDFLTEPVVISSALQYVSVRVDLGAYTTSTSGFEDDDVIAVVAESSSDPSFPAAATTQWPIYGALPLATTGGAEFYNLFKVSQPEAMNYGVTVPFPAADFPLTRRSVVFDRGAHSFVRLRISGGPTAATSEHALVDNIFIERGLCTLSASGLVLTRDNKGDDDLGNDEFSATVTINAVANGASSGWTSTTAPGTGSYGQPVSFGPFPVSGGAVTVLLLDQLDSACTLTLDLVPPVCTVSLDLDTANLTLIRNNSGTAGVVNDDTIALDAIVTGTNGGTGWTSNIPVPGAPGTFYGGAYGATVQIQARLVDVPALIILRDLADPNCLQNINFTAPHEPVYGMGSIIPLTGPAVPIPSVDVLDTNGWNNPADGVLTQDNGGGTVSHDVSSTLMDISTVGELLFTAELVVTEDSAGSNFEAADTFDITLVFDRGLGSETVDVIGVYDADANGVMNGADDTPAGAYDADPSRDEFNRPLPGVPLASNIIHTFQFSGVIPADAALLAITVHGLNNSATEHYRLQNVRFTERAANPNADTDGDGVGNADEAIMGTNPNDALSVTRLAQTAGNPSQFSFEGVAGRFYRVYVSDDAAPASHLAKWVDAGLGSFSGAGLHTVTVTPTAGVSRRSYRIHVRESDADWPAVVPAP